MVFSFSHRTKYKILCPSTSPKAEFAKQYSHLNNKVVHSTSLTQNNQLTGFHFDAIDLLFLRVEEKMSFVIFTNRPPLSKKIR